MNGIREKYHLSNVSYFSWDIYKSLDPVDVSCADLEDGGGGGLGGLENPKFLNSHNNYNNVPENRNLKPAPNFYHY